MTTNTLLSFVRHFSVFVDLFSVRRKNKFGGFCVPVVKFIENDGI